MDIQPLTLEGAYIRLEPLSLAHLDALCEVGLDAELWRWSPVAIRTSADMRAYIENAIEQREKGVELPFVTFDKTAGSVVGSTRFGNIDRLNRRVEIGWTWVAPMWQRSSVNTEAKYLMLRHAFETLDCLRVEFKTDSLNEKSRNALLRIGAKEEGILRNHMITYTGRLRHSVYYSIIDSEWLTVKKKLEEKLAPRN